jgi:hypothetical protein
LANIAKIAQSYNASNIPTQPCPQATPYYNQTSKTCVPLCTNGNYLDLALGICVPPVSVTNIAAIRDSGLYL